MIVVALLAAALSVTPPPFSLKQTPLNKRQAEHLKAIEPCLKWNAEQAAYRKQQYRQTGRKAPQGQYAVIRRVGECSVATPMR
jgi:hypothetical protein